jgi:toxin YoeB
LVKRRPARPAPPDAPWTVVFTLQAAKDAKKISQQGLRTKVESLLERLAADPYRTPPPFEKLVGDLSGAISRRINIQHRLVYEVLAHVRTVRVLRMWTHYE